MAVRGRKPTPVAEKITLGNPGHRPLTTLVPSPRKRKPTPSAIVAGDARAMRHWAILMEDVHPDHLLRIDTGLLERYCKCLSRAEEAEETMELKGTMVRSPNGTPMQSPYLAVVNRQTEMARKLASELGITPSQRNRQGIHDAQDDDPVDRYFDA